MPVHAGAVVCYFPPYYVIASYSRTEAPIIMNRDSFEGVAGNNSPCLPVEDAVYDDQRLEFDLSCHEFYLSDSTDTESLGSRFEEEEEDVCQNDENFKPVEDIPVKKVRFGSVTTREYGVTVGAFCATNGCPLQLTWEHSETDLVSELQEEENDTAEWSKRSRPRQLTAVERRHRVSEIQNLPSKEVSVLEYQTTLFMIEETMKLVNRSFGTTPDSPTKERIHRDVCHVKNLLKSMQIPKSP